jgi:3-methyl-2-oxobutanoate hydroxymethyltransferase
MKRIKHRISDFSRMKEEGRKVTFITSYDYQMAKLIEREGIDIILVGDSAGNNHLGYKDTRPVTMDEMIMLSKAVRRGANDTYIVGDMPLGSYQASNEIAVNNALRFIKEAEMDAVKCEGGSRIQERVKAMADAGIAVMGHIGYTPQSTNLAGVVHGKSIDNFKGLLGDAKALQESGVFSILLEAVPNLPAGLVAKAMEVPVYGIGAGREVDGVLSIVNDVIGLGNFKSRFIRNFCNSGELIGRGIQDYIHAVKSKEYPSKTEMYPLSESAEKEIIDYAENNCLKSF